MRSTGTDRQRVLPEFLYKYVELPPNETEQPDPEKLKTARDRFEAILVEQKLWFSSPDQFNDPYDCLPRIEYSGMDRKALESLHKGAIFRLAESEENWGKIKSADAKRIQELLQLHPFIDEESTIARADPLLRKSLRSDFGVLCLSSNGCDPVMAYHYTGAYKGLILKFKTQEWFGDAEPVEYVETRPLVRLADEDGHMEQYEQIFLHKYVGWRYESEWRIVTARTDPYDKPGRTYRYYGDPEILCGVTFAPNVEAENQEYVKSLLRLRPSHDNLLIRTSTISASGYVLEESAPIPL